MGELQFNWDDIPWGLVVPLVVIHIILVITALIDCIRAERTNGPKWLWILIILFIQILGPVLYFVAGRRQR